MEKYGFVYIWFDKSDQKKVKKWMAISTNPKHRTYTGTKNDAKTHLRNVHGV